MRYREIAPPPALRPFIQCIWLLRGDGRGAPPQRVLPDGSVELVFHLGDRFHRHEPSGVTCAQPDALVVGEVTRAVILQPGDAVDLIAVRFRPGAARGILGIPPAELAGGFHDLDGLAIRPFRSLFERLGNTASDDDRLAALLDALHRAARQPAPPAPVLAALARVGASHGRVAIPELAGQVGWSLRHLERRVLGELGMTPKEFARLRRFHWVVSQLGADDPPEWSRLAVRAGYHDQPHLVREFREFAGTTPAAYWRETHPLSDLFHGAGAG